MTSHVARPATSALDVSWGVRRRWWLVLVLALVAGAASAALTAYGARQYAATVTLIVQLPRASADTEALVRTVESLTTSPVVLGDLGALAGVRLTPAEVEDRLRVERPAGSAVIEVTAEDTSRQRAQTIAENIVPILQARLPEVDPATLTTDVAIRVEWFGDKVQVIRTDPPTARNGVLGFAVGAAVGLLAATALASRDAARRSGGLPRSGAPVVTS